MSSEPAQIKEIQNLKRQVMALEKKVMTLFQHISKLDRENARRKNEIQSVSARISK
jgi:predicted  nucleic acid-binding Zn-ribbon protein